MGDNFKTYSLSVFDALNKEIVKKLSALEANEIDKTISNLMKIEDYFSDIETKLDLTINKLIVLQIMKDMNNELK